MNSSGVLKVALATGVNDLFESSFNIYPNPVRDVLIIELNGSNDQLRFELCDVTGRKHIETDYQWTKTTNLNLSDLKSGIYILRIIGKDSTLVKTIVKQ